MTLIIKKQKHYLETKDKKLNRKERIKAELKTDYRRKRLSIKLGVAVLALCAVGSVIDKDAPETAYIESNSNYIDSEKFHLALNIYHEARGEGWQGMDCVAKVVYNRQKSYCYQDNIIDITYKHKAFSWTYENKLEYIKDAPINDYTYSFALKDAGVNDIDKWHKIYDRYANADLSELCPNVYNSTLYANIPNSTSKWVHNKTEINKMAKVGNHTFWNENRCLKQQFAGVK